MVVDREQLVELFRYLADQIESGDSLEGSIQYLTHTIRGKYKLTGSFRTGNSEGQGGMFLTPENEGD